MEVVVRKKLCELIAEYGKSLCDDPRRCEALLKDVCAEHGREIFVLVSTLKERVAEHLLASHDSLPIHVLVTQLSKRLNANLGFADDVALETLRSSNTKTLPATCPPPEPRVQGRSISPR